jgi:hypothetical protein
MIKTIPNFIRNAADIVAYVSTLDSLFTSREGEDSHAGFIPNVLSKFKTLKDEVMPDELKRLIFSDADWDDETREFWEFIQIQKYDIGDYIVPHRDAYRIRKLHLVTLTSSTLDGLVCETLNKELIFIPDKAGQYIDFPYSSAHYVSPVRELRYSIVIGI